MSPSLPMTWDTLVETAATLFRTGGVVMWPLLATGVALWYLLALRALRLLGGEWRASPGGAREGLRALFAREGERLVGEAEMGIRARLAGLERYGALTETLVVAAPLLGLLGTVSGMRVTFAALTDMALFSQTGGIAGGVAEALTTTQLGLGVAVPGLLVHQLLERRAARLRGELDAALVVCRELIERDAPGAAP